ncbi:hypothetical protein F5141DRAFT_504904 [Pisolithus sp. B1]|nr:hypothetical protein F5141DRAFT_504904 [Pisolithus sp. B1]
METHIYQTSTRTRWPCAAILSVCMRSYADDQYILSDSARVCGSESDLDRVLLLPPPAGKLYGRCSRDGPDICGTNTTFHNSWMVTGVTGVAHSPVLTQSSFKYSPSNPGNSHPGRCQFLCQMTTPRSWADMLVFSVLLYLALRHKTEHITHGHIKTCECNQKTIRLRRRKHAHLKSTCLQRTRLTLGYDHLNPGSPSRFRA